VRRSFWVGSGSGRVGVGFRRVVGLALAGGKIYQNNNLTQQQQR
jgi:hypothetical protein